MRKYDHPKYIQLLDTAKDLFWKHGIKRITVEEICRQANVSKMTFYRFFPNKTAIAKNVLDHMIDEGIHSFRQIITEEISPPEKMQKILLMKMEGTNDISREMLEDIYNTPGSELQIYMEQKTNDVWTEIIKDFKNAQRNEGWIRKDLNLDFLVPFSKKLMELASDADLIKLYSTPREFIMELAKFWAYGISPR